MKKTLLITTMAAALLISGVRGFSAGQAETEVKSEAKAELQKLVGQVQSKLQQGKQTEKDLAEDLKAFDALLARHKGEKTDDVAQILVMKAMLYLQVFQDLDKGKELVNELKKEFPDTTQGQQADELLAQIEKQEEAKKVQANLVAGAKFPDFEEKDLAGKPLSIANYKGKVVLIDFWATWCGPCIAELPNLLKAYEKHHQKGFEIIGISLDREEEALTSFIKKRNMPWQQYLDVGNKLAAKYGINSIPATFLLDGEGRIIAKDLRGEALVSAVGKALAKP